ncbi:hypothetical protein K1719_035729 [Acacia pycnantha]|nr:hypothetical protein K1719_035729 [Acacia pycnantha]
MKIIVVVYVCVTLFVFLSFTSKANHEHNLEELILSKRSKNKNFTSFWEEKEVSKQQYYVSGQEGRRQADKISALPGQPYGVKFDQYSGPGCSSLGYGAFQELGPFRVNSNGETLFLNKYAWNNVANVLFLESPAGVGFSYSNTSSDYDRADDELTANDAYTFLINWLERFPQYKSRDFFITGESYAGHYVPQLAYTILVQNKINKQTIVNLKGINIGNAWIDEETNVKGRLDYLWTHALISDETLTTIDKYCDLASGNVSELCLNAIKEVHQDIGQIDPYNIYAPICHDPSLRNGPPGSVYNYDPCSNYSVHAYLNNPKLQLALHALPTLWTHCREYDNWPPQPTTILPIINYLISSGIRVWLYSGDTDGVVPVTSTRYSINRLKLPVEVPWRTWYSGNEVGGYVEHYKGLTFVTVRRAGHTVPSWQPARALTLITSFLKHSLPPASPWP